METRMNELEKRVMELEARILELERAIEEMKSSKVIETEARPKEEEKERFGDYTITRQKQKPLPPMQSEASKSHYILSCLQE